MMYVNKNQNNRDQRSLWERTMPILMAFVALALMFHACSKVDYKPRGVASLTMVNAVQGSSNLLTNFRGIEPIVYSTTSGPAFGRWLRYSLPAGENILGLYQLPDTLIDSNPVFVFHFDFPRASIHTLFLAGTVDQPEYLQVEETLPIYQAADSLMGIRFINLSVNGPPLAVNLKGQPFGSEVESLPYLEYSAFRPYRVSTNQEDYVFEIRRADTGELMISYTTQNIAATGTAADRNTWIYRNFTLALIGEVGSTGANAPRLELISHAGF